MPVGLPGRLSKGAGTHLASWLQETTALTAEEGQALLDGTARPAAGPRAPLAERAEAGLWAAHGARAGHAKPVTGVAHSGDLLATKDAASLRLWRARGDFALLRVVTCAGPHVAFHPSGQFLVTGARGAAAAGGLKIWGPAGASAFAAGKKSIAVPGRRAPGLGREPAAEPAAFEAEQRAAAREAARAQMREAIAARRASARDDGGGDDSRPAPPT